MRHRPPSMLTLMLVLLLSSNSLQAEVFRTGGPATTNNDDSCDISLLPAATLLLPYFEVDVTANPGNGETTVFTVTNTTNLPQVARVTLWTDRSYPILGFNIFLTGYDAQSINLYDVIVRGGIAPGQGTGVDVSPVGELSGDSAVLDNPLLDEQGCSGLPVQIPNAFLTRLKSALTLGKAPAAGSLPACERIGGVHTNAVGYVTIDVVATCTPSLPTDAVYFASEILFDNVLMGDYLQIDGWQNYAQGSPMVHIRAIPEGGTVASRATDVTKLVNVRRTFYSRYQPAFERTRDARQPLPALFAARWIAGGPTAFQTLFKIWREGNTGSASSCEAQRSNATLGITEIVRFDEEENPETGDCDRCSPPFSFKPTLPSTSMTAIDDSSVFPPNPSASVAGWMYMNFDSSSDDSFASQNWVVVSMRADGRFSTDFDALALGNGCTPQLLPSEAKNGADPIGPAKNVN